MLSLSHIYVKSYNLNLLPYLQVKNQSWNGFNPFSYSKGWDGFISKSIAYSIVDELQLGNKKGCVFVGFF